jgi:hypothetical protein
LTVAIGIPVFVHYALIYIRKGLPGARKDLIAWRAAARADYNRTRQMLRRRNPDSGSSLEEVDMMNKNASRTEDRHA